MKFTPLELRELGELRDVDMIVQDEDFDYDDQARTAIAANKQVMVMDRILQGWRKREVGEASRRLHLHWWARPVEILGDGRVEAIRWERTEPDGLGGARGTGRVPRAGRAGRLPGRRLLRLAARPACRSTRRAA